MKSGANNKQTWQGMLRRFFRITLLLYVLVCIGCASFQRSMIYFPPKFTPAEVEAEARATSLTRWTNSAGVELGMKRLSPHQPSAGSVLVVYGNASWSVGSAHYADEIQGAALLDVFILEYPGYADRTGTPSQTNFFRAADEAFTALGTNQPVYVVGESLGSGVVAYLAGKYPGKISGLLLISPYNRLTAVAQAHMPFLPVSWLLVDRFPSEDYLQKYHGPVGIVVDGQDTVVPKKFGLKLYDHYAGPKRLWNFPNGGHIAIMEPPEQFWPEVLDFWRISPLTRNSQQPKSD
jgi:pimeloyl-ACP methyl ester carboxylesterase